MNEYSHTNNSLKNFMLMNNQQFQTILTSCSITGDVNNKHYLKNQHYDENA